MSFFLCMFLLSNVNINVHVMCLVMLMFMLFFSYLCVDYINVYVVEFYLYYLLFTNSFCLFEFTENRKKKKSSLQVVIVVSFRILV